MSAPMPDRPHVPPRRRARRACVRSGEISARELVQASLDRIEELNPQLNAFVDVFAEEALAEADGDRRRRPAAVRRRADRDQEQPRGRGQAADARGRVHGRLRRAVTTTTSCAGCATAGFVIVGTTTLPEWGILPVTEARRFGPTRNPWDLDAHAGRLERRQRGGGRRRAWSRSRTATTAAARPASRPPAAGSSASSRSAAASRWRPRSATSFLVAGRRADAARSRRPRSCSTSSAGYELGDAYWAPPPAEPFAAQAARERRAGCGSRSRRCRRSRTARSTRSCAQAARDAGRAARVARPRGRRGRPAVARRRRSCEMFTAVLRPAGLRCRSPSPGWSPAASRRPRTWSRSAGRSASCAKEHRLASRRRCATVQLQASPARSSAWIERLRRARHAGARRGAGDARHDRPAAPTTRWATFARSGHFTPFTAAVNITGQPAISAAAVPRATTACRSASSSSASPRGEGALLALAAQLEAARPGRDRRAGAGVGSQHGSPRSDAVRAAPCRRAEVGEARTCPRSCAATPSWVTVEARARAARRRTPLGRATIGRGTPRRRAVGTDEPSTLRRRSSTR